jgi:two-component system nitrate/nitrite response regulator NarL
MTTTIAIVEDHALIAAGLGARLNRENIDSFWVEPTRQDPIETVIDRQPDLVVVDLDLGTRLRGDDLIEPLVDAGFPPLLMTGSLDEPRVAHCLRAGATGVIWKSLPLEEIAHRILDGLDGRPVNGSNELADLMALAQAQGLSGDSIGETLTEREQTVLQGLVDGQSPVEISDNLIVGLSTVRSHIRSILCKLGVSSQVGAVSRAVRDGWLPSPQADRSIKSP